MICLYGKKRYSLSIFIHFGELKCELRARASWEKPLRVCEFASSSPARFHPYERKRRGTVVKSERCHRSRSSRGHAEVTSTDHTTVYSPLVAHPLPHPVCHVGLPSIQGGGVGGPAARASLDLLQGGTRSGSTSGWARAKQEAKVG